MIAPVRNHHKANPRKKLYNLKILEFLGNKPPKFEGVSEMHQASFVTAVPLLFGLLPGRRVKFDSDH